MEVDATESAELPAGGSDARSAWLRVTWALMSVGLVAIVVFALSATPPLLFLRALWNLPYPREEARMLVVAIAMLPAYGLFACMLVLLSALSTRLVGWRTPADVTLPISSLDPQLLTWVQSMVMLHLVRMLAGSMSVRRRYGPFTFVSTERDSDDVYSSTASRSLTTISSSSAMT